MWRQILGMTAFISFVMIMMFFFVDNMWDIEYAIHGAWFDDNGVATPKCKYFTMLFNIFVYLHLFNEINSRKVSSDSYNVFSNLLDNFYFIGVFIVTIVIQYVMIQYGGRMTRCSPLTGDEHAFCLLVGSTSLIAGLALKFTPESLTKKIPSLFNENENNDNSKIVQFYKKQAETKVSDLAKPKKA